MKQPRSIQYIGGSDEELAHLRLLLRKGRARLQAAWHWDEEAREPDLIVLDPATLVGDAALQQARAGGYSFVCVVDADAPDSGDWQLRRPLRVDAVVRVVNALTPAGEPGARVLSQGEDFFLVDLDEGGSAPLLDPDALDSIPVGAGSGGDSAQHWEAEADALFRRDPDAERLDAIVPLELSADTTFERSTGPTRRSDVRGQEGDVRIGRATDQAQGRAPRAGEQRHDDPRVLPLIDYLERDILGGPCRIAYAGLHELVLDPKHRTYHAAVDLPELELYCLQALPVREFVALTMQEIAAVQASQPGQPWVKLKWLYAVINSNGRLAAHLDPGGIYHLTRFLELARDYPHHFRIATAMAKPRKIHEIASAAGVRIEEVYAVINAFDAIGYLEWELRDRLRGVEPGSAAGDGPGAG